VSDPAARPRSNRPTRPIAILVAVAGLTTVAVLAIAGLSRPTASSIAKGLPVPEVKGTTLDGSSADLAALRGHPVVINFWGPSCVPCRTEFPLLAAKATEHAADGLVILGVLTDDPVDTARAFAADYGGTWQTVIDPGGVIKNAYHVVARPQSYFVDRNGVLQSIQVGELRNADFERQYAAITGGS
jgi:cytochrome c biogenesis protein CcmG, thiol:disulfide interchange protein DsbE